MRHRFHALCPYFATFPESFVEQWVTRLTEPGDLVVDPFSGRGTTAFQSLLLGRRALACDVNPVAYVLTRAKTNSPTPKAVTKRLAALETALAQSPRGANTDIDTSAFFLHAFSPRTLHQLRFLRAELYPLTDDVDCMIAALVLGALHGEITSTRYLSNQMPRTISTKPAYSVRYWVARDLVAPERDVFAVLTSALSFRYASGRPRRRATVHLSDMRTLPHKAKARQAHLMITSPPYLDTTSFEEDQWLRLWFLGGPPHPTKGLVSKDDRHTNADAYWRLIADLWRTAGHLVAPGGHVVVRIAGRDLSSEALRDGLETTSCFAARDVTLISAESSAITRRQTDAFRPGSTGRRTEVDCLFSVT